jgi:hypothetical protein
VLCITTKMRAAVADGSFATGSGGVCPLASSASSQEGTLPTAPAFMSRRLVISLPVRFRSQEINQSAAVIYGADSAIRITGLNCAKFKAYPLQAIHDPHNSEPQFVIILNLDVDQTIVHKWSHSDLKWRKKWPPVSAPPGSIPINSPVAAQQKQRRR